MNFSARWIAAGILVVVIAGAFVMHRQKEVEKAELAAQVFDLLSQWMRSETIRLATEATGSEYSITAVGGGSGHGEGLAFFDEQWELIPREGKSPPTESLMTASDKIRPRLMQLVGARRAVLKNRFPELRMNVDVKTLNNDSRQTLRVSMKFETSPLR